jgi:hypothetical protein
LLRDVQTGNKLQNFLKDFKSKGIDVLSLAEIHAVVDGAVRKDGGSKNGGGMSPE